MFETFKSRTPWLGAAASGLALLGAAALPLQVFAHDDTAGAGKGASAQQVSSGTTASMTVVRDAVTGQLRAPTADELAALQASRSTNSLRVAPAAMLPRVHTSGAQGTRMTDESSSYNVVVRQRDGTLVTFCFSSREEAEAAIKAPPVAKSNTLPTE